MARVYTRQLKTMLSAGLAVGQRVRVRVCVGLAAVLLVALAPAASGASWAQALVRDDVPHLVTENKWGTGSGGGSGTWGDDAGFWYVTEPGYRAVWDFGHLEGLYRPVFYLPGVDGNPPADPMPSGPALYEVQVRGDTDNWVTVEQFTRDQGKLAQRGSIWWYPTYLRDGVALDGETRVRVSMARGGSGIVAADSFRLRWRGELPDEVEDTLPEPDLDPGPVGLPQYPHSERCDERADKWWMIRGQCTSYVAFRLNEAGVPLFNTFHIVDPSGRERWGKFGDATYWTVRGDRTFLSRESLDGKTIKFYSGSGEVFGPRRFKVTINDAPKAGSLAHWHSSESGSSGGHVAYVESVVDADTIVVSDMNGESSTDCTIAENIQLRRGDRWSDGSRRWPGRFIHFDEVR